MSIIPIVSARYALPYIFIFMSLFVMSFPLLQKTIVIENKTIIGEIKKSYFIFLFFYFFGLRGFLQTDFIAYYKYFKDVPLLWEGVTDFLYIGQYKDWEKGFLLYTIFIKSLCNNYFFFQAISFLIDFMLLYFFIRYYTSNYFVLSFVFFLLFSGPEIEINLLRNSKCIALFLFSLRYLIQKKYLKYILINLLGLSFHTSAIIYICIGFFLKIKIPKKFLCLCFIIGVVGFVLQISYMSFVLEFLGNLLPGRLGVLIRFYLQANKASISISIGFIERAFSFIFLISNYHYFYNNKDKRVIANSLVIYLCSFFYGYEIPIIYQRIGALFAFSYWIFYPLVYKRLSKERKCIFLLVLLFYGLLKIYSGYRYSLFYYDSVLSLNMFDYNQRQNIVHYYKIFEKENGWIR